MKVVQLMSGGFDSVGQAMLLLNQGHEVQPLYIRFRLGGGKESKEINRSQECAQKLGLPEPIIIRHRIPSSEYDRRDHTLVELAAGIAREIGYEAVAIATSYYPGTDAVANIDWEDMNPRSLEQRAGMKVFTLEMHKGELLHQLEPAQKRILFDTTSCQLWFKLECGRCYRCAERHAAFIVALGYDNTVYNHNPKKAKAWSLMLEKELNACRKEGNKSERFAA